jgi:hypothetical protein
MELERFSSSSAMLLAMLMPIVFEPLPIGFVAITPYLSIKLPDSVAGTAEDLKTKVGKSPTFLSNLQISIGNAPV